MHACIHTYIQLAAFFVAVGWRISLRRTHGDASRGYNGGERLSLNASTSLPLTRHDLAASLRCAVGHNEHNESACKRTTAPVAQTRWGPANLSTSFTQGGRYFVCLQPLERAELERVLARGMAGLPAGVRHREHDRAWHNSSSRGARLG